ncbi:class 1 fructose-bisphosphatase [Halomarina halobia]|uniref:Fructose-1,6-bisphosphatase class 1 n=1 Tax=Halomarina halobia TaxID=3033386 RepID=A0ABD6ACS0_9EURY|nr:class 1 fructose-bisphosphatase [Halomarina sp. PSR21]
MSGDDVIEAVFEAVAAATPEIRESLVGRRRYEAGENPSGEQQLEADVYADQLFEERLLALDGVASYASEEREGIVRADGTSADADSTKGKTRAGSGGDGGDGDYHLALDPLDGSSNVKPNNVMGTIVGVYDEPLPAGGDALVAAGYVLYGPLTTMVTARDGRVTESVVHGGERHAATADLALPDDPTVYGFGGRVPDWTDEFAAYAREVERELKLRYGGAMIGDVSQVLTYGGIFAYPGLTTHPNGKLRLLFEGLPIAAIVETAGGASTDGERSLLERTPEELHERTPVFVGNREYVERAESALSE